MGNGPIDPDPVLSTNTVAYVTTKVVKVKDLTDRKVRSLAWPTSMAPSLALAGQRLLLSAPSLGTGYSIYEAG